VTTDPFAAFRAAVERDDIDAAVGLFSEDVTFSSPVVHKPYVGREALHVIYTGSYGGEDGHVLRFTARVGDRELEGVDILRASDGVLTELTVMVRPYSAATALRDRMAALVS
jgi:hypothetical protein